ncbi:MAG: DUF554 domain-containing protein [Phycisphaerales bacterium]|nr:MAG: DUF554 domain-containing protein [Phycisphaerales bacterium]
MWLQLWSVLNGTLINAATVTGGTTLGLTVATRMPQRYQQIVLSCLGLMTVALGVDAAVLQFASTVETFRGQISVAPQTYGARLAMVMIASLVIGGLIGSVLRLHERIEAFGGWVHRRFSGSADAAGAHRFAEGFLTASVIFCVGPLTLLGCLRNGADADPSYLYIKAVLDGFCSMALAASMGWGVGLSVITVLVFQGGLSLLAFFVTDPLHEVARNMMTTVGGVVMLGNALMILDVKKIPVADLLPGLFLPPAMIWMVERIWPGLLLP